jgi:DNA polymerase-3 subunit beta
MRFTISRERVAGRAGRRGGEHPGQDHAPVLANLLVETTSAGCACRAPDLDIAVSTEVPADVETQGAITIPAKKLQEIARELPPAP